MKKTPTKNKKVTLDSLSKMIAEGREETNDLARMVARGFESMHNEIGEVKNRLGKVEDRLGKVEENLATTRMDVLGIGDRFVSKHEFHQHLIRFSLLEEKVKLKK